LLTDQKILVTGVNGMVARPIAEALARDNEVWGVARFTDPATRGRAEAAGIHAVALDVSVGPPHELPDDFTYVLHLAYHRGGTGDFDSAMRINAEGTGFVLTHCQRARAALVMSSNVIYPPHDDPWHEPVETDAIGGMIPPWSPTSSSAKVAEEAVARWCARALDLPVTVARLNTVYGPHDQLLPVAHMDAVVAGRPVAARWDPHPHRPIHVDDLVGQLEAMLDAASVPATIVNWAGDEQVSIQDWAAMAGAWCGKPAQVDVTPVPGTTRNNLADVSRRQAITGPCQVRFADAFRAIYDERHGTGASPA
jgi:nucleoside-diphosphate-sugar epimerase